MLRKSISEEYCCNGTFYEFSVNTERKGGFFANYFVSENSIYIEGVHILEGQENQGYGTQMMQEAVILLNNKYPNVPIFLTVRGDNYSAIKIYKKAGFIPKEPTNSKKNPLFHITMIFNDTTIIPTIKKEIFVGKQMIKKLGSKKEQRLYKFLFTNEIEMYIKDYKRKEV